MGIASEKNRYSLVVVEKLSISGRFKLQGFQIWDQNVKKKSNSILLYPSSCIKMRSRYKDKVRQFWEDMYEDLNF